jgi:hypothetical protein
VGFGLSRSCFSRLSSRSFQLRLHPNTSLRECVCRCRQPSRPPGGPDTEHSLATVSRCMVVSISLTLRLRGGVQVAPQTGLAGEGLFREGRADATVVPWFHALVVLSWLKVCTELLRPAGCVGFRLVWRANSGTEERVGGAGGGASSPCSPAGGGRNPRTDALGNDSFGLSSRTFSRLFWRGLPAKFLPRRTA